MHLHRKSVGRRLATNFAHDENQASDVVKHEVDKWFVERDADFLVRVVVGANWFLLVVHKMLDRIRTSGRFETSTFETGREVRLFDVEHSLCIKS